MSGAVAADIQPSDRAAELSAVETSAGFADWAVVQLCDEQLEASMAWDYLLFRKFCRFDLDGTTPDAGTFGRFRQPLVMHDLWERLLGEVNRQLEAKNIIMTEARLISRGCPR